MKITTLIFDLGSVLYHVDYERARREFQQLLSAEKQRELPAPAQLFSGEIFKEFETDALSPSTFRDKIRQQYGVNASDEKIDNTWNSMLAGIFPGRMKSLDLLRQKYQILLLSNTNRIHFEYLKAECADLFNLFSDCFYSFSMGLRKPDPEIFRRVTKEAGVAPEHALMIDDVQENIEGAMAAGLQGFHFKKIDDWEVFLHWLAQRDSS